MWIAAPELAIVSESLWAAAHNQMASQRARYSRSSVHGAPPWSIEPKYLLTGLLRCAACGSGMEARSRSHGSRRAVFYGCAAYHRRGTAVCRNALVAPMDPTESAILSAVEATLLHPRVLEAAMHRAVERLCSRQPTEPASVSVALARVERELEHLAAAVAAGGDIPALLAAIREREAHRRDLLQQRQARASIVPLDAKAVLYDLRERLADWRSLLRDEVPRARGLLKQLIVGRLDMTPHREEGSYTFKGTGTLLPVIAGAVPQSVASLTAPNPFMLTGSVVRAA
jgi:hypothetical protein